METPIADYPHNSLAITSQAFEAGSAIPENYTCDGDNVNPPLTISEVPESTLSLVLIVEDPDVPEYVRPDRLWDHWVVFNIPPDTREIEEASVPPSATLGSTTSGSLEYSGPCPPDGEHRYYFRLLALDTTISLPEGATKEEMLEAVEGHVIDSAETMGRYAR